MREIFLVDTSVFCCILNIPNMCSDEQHEQVMNEFRHRISRPGTSLLLPIATIYETGNHIAHALSRRRELAKKFVGFVLAGFDSQPPWTLTPLPNHEQMSTWLAEFPDLAERKVGLGDLSIIKTYEEQCELHRYSRVGIWSLDGHLAGYDRQPSGSLT